MRFLPKAITIYFGKKEGFDYKNNHGCSKLANFWLDNIRELNCKILVVLSYISLRLKARKI